MKNLQLELLLSDKACQIIDNFAYLMNLQVAFYTIDGQVVKRSRNENNCAYCTYMQEKVFSLDDCVNLDLKKQQECRAKHQTLIYQCHAGLTEVVMPIELYNTIAGYVIIGQFRIQQSPPDFLREPELQELFMAQKYISYQELDHIIEMFRTLLEYITEKELISAPSDYRRIKLNGFIDRNFLNDITLAQAARYMKCSVSSLSHYLQEKHHTSLKKLILEKRLRHAEKLIKKHPELTLGEIANQSGFKDSHYFSRIYRKYRNCPPSQLRSQ